jgi:hypothetical protein
MIAMGATAIACKGKTDSTEADKPAVISAPPVVVPSDTAKPRLAATVDSALVQKELAAEYTDLFGAAFNDDRKLVVSMLTPDAVMVLDRSTMTGPPLIAEGLHKFLRAASIKEVIRVSAKLSITDSVFRDSGQYVMLAERVRGKTEEQRGTYVSDWVKSGSPAEWRLRRDVLRPATRR